ncbi:lipid asymmetry maintenance protein MlaB [Pantoea sp. Aalb]|uniref:lipid asymmetry maintenance protein MlaB n=1 Tax=Pantoea sp. Aalb TaxID=2576762 RepID=UPI001321DCDE|nr:lipid asymmetry maintenance protein MlaB [Pantoea sp. Aalb]MXP67822.1 lipid asymmetry maintenance protein MlaB [Pantoea sp. Aalb]
MSNSLYWKCTNNTLILKGRLERDTLLVLWRRRKNVMNNINIINIAELERVDSVGLALLVHLREIARAHGRKLIFIGITDKLRSLIVIYNLQQIIFSAKKVPEY